MMALIGIYSIMYPLMNTIIHLNQVCQGKGTYRSEVTRPTGTQEGDSGMLTYKTFKKSLCFSH